jgi:hypothetical protein
MAYTQMGFRNIQGVHPVVFVYILFYHPAPQQLLRSHLRIQCKMSLLVAFCYTFRLREPSPGNT